MEYTATVVLNRIEPVIKRYMQEAIDDLSKWRKVSPLLEPEAVGHAEYASGQVDAYEAVLQLVRDIPVRD